MDVLAALLLLLACLSSLAPQSSHKAARHDREPAGLARLYRRAATGTGRRTAGLYNTPPTASRLSFHVYFILDAAGAGRCLRCCLRAVPGEVCYAGGSLDLEVA
jgi:hypothetical protein